MATMSLRLAVLVGLGLCVFSPSSASAEVTLERTARGVTVKADGKPFTEYLVKSGAKPILWPVIGPTGKAMTRAFPMEQGASGEPQDHPHQRSFWFTHGSVNGVDFWSENAGHGTIEHREFLKVESGPEAHIATRNDWFDKDGKKQCEDERWLNFHADAQVRWIDFDVVVTASAGPVVFGDTKEGSFGVRVVSSIQTKPMPGGHIVNSEGHTDDATWGKAARWVDYYGPVGGEQLGVAIFNHPSSFRYPTTWHVRDYGLFAANPFGWKAFTAGAKDGEYTLPEGKQMALRYRVVLHKGSDRDAHIAELSASYEKLEKK